MFLNVVPSCFKYPASYVAVIQCSRGEMVIAVCYADGEIVAKLIRTDHDGANGAFILCNSDPSVPSRITIYGYLAWQVSNGFHQFHGFGCNPKQSIGVLHFSSLGIMIWNFKEKSSTENFSKHISYTSGTLAPHCHLQLSKAA